MLVPPLPPEEDEGDSGGGSWQFGADEDADAQPAAVPLRPPLACAQQQPARLLLASKTLLCEHNVTMLRCTAS